MEKYKDDSIEVIFIKEENIEGYKKITKVM